MRVALQISLAKVHKDPFPLLRLSHQDTLGEEGAQRQVQRQRAKVKQLEIRLCYGVTEIVLLAELARHVLLLEAF